MTITIFILGMLVGIIVGIFILAMLNEQTPSTEGNKENPFNPDGTPKRIIFNKNDV